MKSLNGHLSEICSGGWPVMRWKIFAFKHVYLSLYLSLLIHALWAIPVILLIRCLSPWRIIRFGKIDRDIGVFAIDVDHGFALSQRQSKMYLDLYWFQKFYNKTICNDFLAEMTRRNLHVYPWVRPLYLWNQILPGGAIHHISPNQREYCDIHGSQEQPHARMSFRPEEDAQAKDWLHQQGWQEGDLFVCLLMRDNSYTDSIRPNMVPPQKEGIQYHSKFGYGHHQANCRNSDIATYVPAAEWLAGQGVWVLRMGKIMAKPIPCNHPRIIDYAFHPDRSDFLDIWLFAHCNLCISTATGPDYISCIYQRPLLLLNLVQFLYPFSWCNAMHVFKTWVWQASGTPLNMREQINNTIVNKDNSTYYDHIGLRIIDLTPEEILAAVQEGWQRLQGTWVDTEDDLKRNQRFWEILKSHPDFHKFHGWIHPESRAGAIWLCSKGDDYLN